MACHWKACVLQTQDNRWEIKAWGATENISYFSIGDQQGHKGHHPGWMWFAGRKRRTYGKGWCPTTRPSREPGPSPRSARWSSRESGARSGCTRGKSRTSCTTTAACCTSGSGRISDWNAEDRRAAEAGPELNSYWFWRLADNRQTENNLGC